MKNTSSSSSSQGSWKGKIPSIKKIRSYFYIALLIANIVILFYSYLFIKNNIYYSFNFDESNFPKNLRSINDVNMDKFDKVIKKIDEKKISQTLKINDFLDD